MGDDLSDVISLLSTGSYTVTRGPASVMVGGRAMPAITVNQWARNHAYSLGQQCGNGGQAYTCTTAGTSASSGGPTGTGTGIHDNMARWAWAGPASTVIPITASIQPVGGRELDRLAELYRTTELRTVYTSTQLFSGGHQTVPDTIAMDGETWAVQAVSDWSSSGNYYKATLMKVAR